MRINKKNKKTLHPILKLIILLAVYSLGYICGNMNQKQTETGTIISKKPEQIETETMSSNSYNETNHPSDNEQKASKLTLIQDISYSELTENEKKIYDKIIETAINKDNTFITDKELTFNLNTIVSETEALRIQSVFYNNYPNITIYTTRYPDSWMHYVTHLINGIPTYTTYYFNVKYK